MQCDNSQGHWQDGYFNVRLESSYRPTMGDVTIKVTNTLDQGASDESIGYGDMKLEYEFGDFTFVLPTESPVNVDEGVRNPTELWQNDCGATEKECAGFKFFGGHNECG
jgi:hypothetical protein